MAADIYFMPQGTVTSARGFQAGADYAGINTHARHNLDTGILWSESPCVTAGVFTRNRVKAAPVALCQNRLPSSAIRAVVVNSGCANASTGDQGILDATKSASMVADKTGVMPSSVLVASTGVIGRQMPMDLLRAAVGKIRLSAGGGHDLAKAIMTTDTVPKEVAVQSEGFIIGGIAKGSGMIHPDMATMLCFLTTDARVDDDFLGQALTKAMAQSLNMISVDGDTSTNDTALLLANGQAGGPLISAGSDMAVSFQDSLNTVCVYLAKAIARDGEGATKLIEIMVSGARSVADARLAARTISSSSLVKTAIHGNDPNWGRVIAAAGRSGAELEETKLELCIGPFVLLKEGQPLPFKREEVVSALNRKEVFIHLDLHLGEAEATAWGCDLSAEYVRINAEYTT